MKKIFIFALALLTVASFALGISANRTLPLVVDNADLLTSLEETSLTATLDDISSRYEIEIAIVTVNSTSGKSAMDYADDFYDDNGYGWGEGDDGILLLIDMGGREWWITTHGRGAYYLNDYYLYEIENAIIDDLSAGNYVDAFYTFANMCKSYIIRAKYEETNYTSDDYFTDAAVTSYRGDYYYDYDEYDEGGFSFSYIVPSVIVGFIIAFIMVSIMKGGMKSVRPASGAADYMVRGSLNLRSQSDRYLYSNTVRTRRDTSPHGGGHHDPRGGGFGGGSSMHRSSSGRSHGGRGGRF